MPTEQTMRGASSANDHAPANLASQMRVACSSMFWNTGARSPGELEMTFNTSAVAFSRSIASFSCRVRVSSFSCRLATEERPWRAALGELRFGFVVLPGRVLADFRLTVRRRLTERSPGPTTVPYHIIRTVVHHSKTDCPMSGLGHVWTALDWQELSWMALAVSKSGDKQLMIW